MASLCATASRSSDSLEYCPPSKGNLSVPLPTGRGCFLFFLTVQAGRSAVPSTGQLSLVLVQGEEPVDQRAGETGRYFLAGLTAITTANTTVRQFRKPEWATEVTTSVCASVMANAASRATFAQKLFWATDPKAHDLGCGHFSSTIG